MNRMPSTMRAAGRPRPVMPAPGGRVVEALPPLDERSMRVTEFLVAGVVLVAVGLLSFVR